MSKICRCDRCGKEIKTYYTIKFYAKDADEGLMVSSESFGYNCRQILKDTIQEKQFCNECRLEIEEFMTKREKGEGEND